MDKIAALFLIAILPVVSVASLGYYVFSQSNPTENNPSPTPKSTPPPTPTPSPSETPVASASVPTPSVPEFTVALVDASYDVPTTYLTDTYTGKQVTHEGYHVARTAIEVKIKNQPSTPYTGGYGREIKFYYNVRIKGHFAEEWGKWDVVWKPEEMLTQSNS